MSRKILIVDDLHPLFKETAEKAGFIVDDFPQFTREETLNVIADYEGLAIRTKFKVDKGLMDKAPRLRLIARAGAGMDNIDEEHAAAKGITCINAPEGNCDAVGEHAVGMLLSLTNNLRKGDWEVRNKIWDREGNRGFELKGKTIGIIGCGFMGRSFAQKLKGFEVSVLAYDKYKSSFGDAFCREAGMEEIFSQSDVLSLHIPLTAETRQLVNEEFLSSFQKPIFLLNTARGEIVNTQAVLNAIKDGKILGAGLDVLEVEKFPALAEQPWFQELISNGKVLLSPHVAGWSFESYRRISEVLAEKFRRWLKDR